MSRLLILLFVLGLAGCAMLTPYQPVKGGYGYSEQRLEADRYRIVFAGSEATPKQTVENYLLFRAAELTVANGGEHFVVAESSMQAQGGGGGPSIGIGLGGFRFGGSGGLGLGIGTSTSTGGDRIAWRAQADIVIRKGPKPDGATDAYTARELINNLQPLVRRPNP